MRLKAVLLAIAGIFLLAKLSSAEEKATVGYTDTPLLPGSHWHVHDSNRPQPKVVTPGAFGTADVPGRPPSDAVVLFDGRNLDAWRDEKGDAPGWKVEHGYVEVVPGSGSLVTKEKFGDSQLHLEFREPIPAKGNGQERGNSGVFLADLYEVQLLDSYDNPTYADGQASAIYGQTPPLVNAARPPGEWQSYDIVYTNPRFKDGKLTMPGYVTVFHNGVITQNHTELLGATGHRTLPKLVVHDPVGPIKLQDHHAALRFRNIWIRPVSAAH